MIVMFFTYAIIFCMHHLYCVIFVRLLVCMCTVYGGEVDRNH